MNKVIKIYTLCFLLFCFACADKKKQQSNQRDAKNISDSATSKQLSAPQKQINKTADVYFKASGTEPFWSLTISEKMIKLKTIGDSIITPHIAPLQAQDANIKQYKLHTEKAKLNIQIKQSECINAMSGMASPYAVDVEFKKGKDTEFTKLEGCGNYITDYRLHDIWVLETLNGNKVSTDDFMKDLPSMEIISASNTFTGYAGCNRMNGKLFFEKGLLRFTNIATTKMLCGQSNLEKEFLKALKSTTTYKIENNRLWLSNPSEELLIFKKID